MKITLAEVMRGVGRTVASDHIEKTRKRVYEISQELPIDEGYELIEDYDKAIKYAKQLGEGEESK